MKKRLGKADCPFREDAQARYCWDSEAQMMSDVKLGRLERVEVRDVWGSEAGDFTPWLAREENLKLLGETIGVDLELEATEKNVGPFRADILCKDTATGHWVLIENQLEPTDHKHLGQLLTYAAGLDAVTIVWLAKEFTDEHRATLDWLNQITDDKFEFFGLEIELWRIADSIAAPKFNIIAKPNDWTNSVSSAASAISKGNLTEIKSKQYEYWIKFHDYILQSKSYVRPQRPYPQHWMNFSIGRSGFLLGATLNMNAKRAGVELYINSEQALPFFNLLHEQKEEIEREIGERLEWQDLPGKKACRIVIFKQGCDPFLAENWPQLMSWMKKYLEIFTKVFGPRIKKLNPDDWAFDEPGENQ
ncbi:DUF4268 domain-containing protein [Desulfovibrio aminophilus]|uniref:DUF4268 domain-containing protein n=1 Tax=Desulfovibrio aminophilus TaxID=81425 RepID=UPI001FE017AA|nr:DUF4268 domain-containing protein [Desulfovibrio aminophilus]